MENYQILLIIIALTILAYYIHGWMFGKSLQLTKLEDATRQQTIRARSLPNDNTTSNYTYSTWFYVDDWNYRFGEAKILLGRLDENNQPSPSIVFTPMENNINISVSCYPSVKSEANAQPNIHNCKVQNFPLQKWVNLLISLYGRTLDVYLDGKLVRTCVLPGVSKTDPRANIFVTPNGGFSGFTSNFEYWAHATNPQQAYNIYKAGYGGSMFGNLFNKYRIKIAFVENNKEINSLEI
jgi:hypothetical protein